MIIRAFSAALAGLLLLAPVAAGAQSPSLVAPEQPTPAPAPERATASITLVAERVGSNTTVLSGSRVRLRGTMRPYVAGQSVVVRVKQGGRSVYGKKVAVAESGSSGAFLLGYKPKHAGAMRITASHLTTPQQASARSKTVTVGVLPRRVTRGTSGGSVRAMQAGLKSLGYVTGKSGSYDARTARAVVAFRKQAGMSRIASADRPFFSAMARGQGSFKVRYAKHGRHVEADLTHQTLALIGAGGNVERIYPLSSGKPSTPTVLGTFRVYRKDHGTNAKGMVDASYFIGGYAIHGYHSVPTYAASHGCLRVPVPDARSISNWVRHRTIVDVYYR